MNELAKNLKFLRNKVGMTQYDLAKELNISQTSVAHYELGTRQPSIETLINMSSFFKASIDLMVGNNLKSHNTNETGQSELMLKLLKSLIEKNKYEFYRLVETHIVEKHDFKFIVENYYKKILYKVGELWEVGLISEADEHYATNIIRKVSSALNINIKKSIKRKKALLFTVNSEQHTLGLEIVSDYLEIIGVDSLYLGNNLQIKSVVSLIEEYIPDYIFISVTMENSINDLMFDIEYLMKEIKNPFAIGVGGQAVHTFKHVNKHGCVVTLDGLSDIEKLVSLQ